MGSCPSWYPLIAAARWMGVAPWELEQQPAKWMYLAAATSRAEAHAQEMKNR